MIMELVHLARSIRRSPASAVAAVLTLSLALGAGTAIFAIVDAIVLTPPPFADPDALVTIGEAPVDDFAAAPRAVSYATFDAWRERASSLAKIEAFDGTNLTLTGIGAAERVSASYVTPGFLPLLGAAAAMGRTLALDDVGERVAVVSHGFWRGQLAADPGVIGTQIVLGGQAHTIVGVLPEQFFFALNACELWLPFPAPPVQTARLGYRVSVVARLARDVVPAHVEQALEDVSRQSSPPSRVVARRLATAIAGEATRTLGLLAGAAALALLVAFTNLTGLLFVRSIDRQRELAVRSALGAPGAVIARHLLLEALALVAAGIAGGVVLALWMTPVAARLALEQFGDLARRDVAVSWRAIAVVSLLASVCACVCGSLPAFSATRRSIVDGLRRGATPPRRELALRRGFVTGEIALAFVLLVSMTLIGRSLVRVLKVNPGFDPEGVLALQVSVPAAGYGTLERVVTFYSTLQSALEERLGPRTISIANEVPLTGDRGRTIVGVRPAETGREAVVREVSTGYFDVMRIPVASGRSFAAADNAAAPPRVVVSKSLAQGLFPGDDPVGRRVWLAAAGQAAEIVGVVGDVKHRALDELPVPTVYRSAWQSFSRSRIVVVRSARSNADVMAVVRAEVARLDRDLPVYGTRSMSQIVAASPGVPAKRVLTATFIGFATLAVVLGAIGLFGIVAHDVARRRAELAIRMALGADRIRIASAIAGQGAWMVGCGLTAGSLLSIWSAHALRRMLVVPDELDFFAAGVAAAAIVITGVAAVLPAVLRAVRTDPLVALRAE